MRIGYYPNMTAVQKLMSLPYTKIPKMERWEGDDRKEITHGISLFHFGITRLPVPNDTLTDDVITPPNFPRHLFDADGISYKTAHKFMEIDVHKIVPSQQYVCRQRILDLIESGVSGKPVLATLYYPYTWIVDGHHRLALKLLQRHLRTKKIYCRLAVPQEA